MKYFSKKLTALLLAIVLIASVLPMSVFAEDVLNVFTNGKYTAEKISNPTTFEGEVDGLENGGDRLNSYAWCIEELGDYIYIGSNRNVIYSGVLSYTTNLDPKLSSALVDAITNGEIPAYYIDENGDEQPESLIHYYSSTAQACIVRYNTKTKEMETWFDSAEYGEANPVYSYIYGFRGAMTFNGEVYMNAMQITQSGINSVLFRITNDLEEPELVEGIEGCSNLRAMNTSEDGKTLYLGGNTTTASGYTPVIYKTTDGVNYEIIGDSSDSVLAQNANDVWDLVEYNGALYVTFWRTDGAACCKGEYNAETGQWQWTQFIGNDGEYPLGFGNADTVGTTPYVYNDELYFITFSDTYTALTKSCAALLTYLSAEEEQRDINTVFEGMKDIESVIKNQTYVYRLTKDGDMEMVVGNEESCDASINFKAELGSGFSAQGSATGTTGYNWRAAIYNGKLYIGTMDASSIFNYFTKLTNGDLLNMNVDEFRQQLYYVKDLLEIIVDSEEAEAEALQVNEAADLTTEKMQQLAAEAYKAEELEIESVSEWQVETNEVPAEVQTEKVEAVEDSVIDQIIEQLVDIQQNLDKEATIDTVYAALENIPEIAEQLTIIQERLGYLCELYKDYPEIYQSLTTAYDAVKSVADELKAIDEEGLNRYILISKTLTANENRGFELYSTTDGIHYDTVTNNGFNDKYNYGVRTLKSTATGLYLGTANPFYGAQLWKITDGDEEVPGSSNPGTGIQMNNSTLPIIAGLTMTALLVFGLSIWRKRKAE